MDTNARWIFPVPQSRGDDCRLNISHFSFATTHTIIIITTTIKFHNNINLYFKLRYDKIRRRRRRLDFLFLLILKCHFFLVVVYFFFIYVVVDVYLLLLLYICVIVNCDEGQTLPPYHLCDQTNATLPKT